MSEARDRGASGGIYNPVTLRLYDAGVLGLTNRLIWRCPTATMVEHYRSHAGRSHLDVGPGTGYFLERIDSPSLTLLDLNASCLAAASVRVGHGRSVASLQQSFFDPLPREHSFDSIGLNFLLHCIPSHEKWDRLSQLRGHLRPGGTIFGSTLIPDPETATLAARALNSTYNKLGVFGNADDTMDELENALRGYAEVSTRRVGQVALFSARRPQEDHT
ncbi:class I SAM-dependent methyltransferase [Dietzia cinnamea]|jgi:SAM-dependent methyltransferase|uniref:class I SAM-dependent methyltransferase n=1 Tax=Dietzia TaxID=37914 RepID=UPI000BDF8B8C|nr:MULTISPECIES: class I SAM-dependent methyltransferase [Dietzia]MCT2031660.1 class I SAM-dependent methyltransferase [Dietzia cinnamea]MDV3357244.1 class I SAM-dependent methyltransferase [Dietzia sp. IN118]